MSRHGVRAQKRAWSKNTTLLDWYWLVIGQLATVKPLQLSKYYKKVMLILAAKGKVIKPCKGHGYVKKKRIYHNILSNTCWATSVWTSWWNEPSFTSTWPHSHLNMYLGVPVIGLFKFQVLSCFACQIKPFPLKPLHGRLPRQVWGVHFSHKCDVLACQEQKMRRRDSLR